MMYSTPGIPFRRGYLLHGVPGRSVESILCSLNVCSNVLQREDFPYSLSSRRTWSRHLCRQSFVQRVSTLHFKLLLAFRGLNTVSFSSMSDNTLATLMGQVPTRFVHRRTGPIKMPNDTPVLDAFFFSKI